MSSLCSASSNILTLRDQDLAKLGYGASSQVKRLGKRRININLGCNFTINGPRNSSWKLEVVAWKNGRTDLCGSCSFCSLLADSMERSVEADLWHLSSELDLILSPQPLNLHANICFKTLEYQKDDTPWAVKEQGLQSMSSWDVYLLLLTGHVLLHTPEMDPCGKPKRIKVALAFELFGEEEDPIVKLLKVHRRPLYGPGLSDENVAKIRDWIKDCDETHERCWADLKHLDCEASRTAAMNFLPARLIDVGDALNGKPPRLVITSEMKPSAWKDEPTEYMALSYCWGPVDETSRLLKTTHDTMGSRMEKIELDTMPLVFQDAVTVAQTLNIQYLWIDSLCIIQDDTRDWQIESSKMAEIFSNAYLTLIAASSSGSNDSFLSRGLPGPSCAVPLKIPSEESVLGEFSLRFRRRWLTSDKMAEISSSRWITRGWTFQEERLARRVLMFGESKLFFDCRTLERAEDTDLYKLRPNWVASVTKVPRQDQMSNQEQAEIDKHWDHWQTLCYHYSHRELTFPEDKLPAISGIASNIAKKAPSEYLAGLWRNNLTHDLFWQTMDVVSKPKKYRAPSWSWASLDGRINWPSWKSHSSCTKCTMYCTVLDAQTTPVGLDSFGAVKDGFLKVQGSLEDVKLKGVGRDGSQRSWRLDRSGKEIGNVSLDIETNDIRLHWRENTYQAILVAKCEGRKESETPIRGLLLTATGRNRENHKEYERVGTFTLISGILPGKYGNLWNKNAEQVIVII